MDMLSLFGGGGFGSYLLGLNNRIYEQAGVDTQGNTPGSYKEPRLDWMIGFPFVSSFVGLLALVPLRKDHDNRLLELTNEGLYYVDNGFKPGALKVKEMEARFKSKLPGCDIKGKPHIESRLKTLRKKIG